MENKEECPLCDAFLKEVCEKLSDKSFCINLFEKVVKGEISPEDFDFRMKEKFGEELVSVLKNSKTFKNLLKR
ncbi:MAG TPA: hypothetical protein ENG63_07020 [Candidatus Desulfofervidus auxilii]|uniref:Uncharacterized protein n=1 Tax=Desulfofervidus auxilii TaxID=1621989 RepID=A0A7C0YAJ0_DESA2|nr:hypothetical protein [Candidatus Desulfofervidus auxilii]